MKGVILYIQVGMPHKIRHDRGEYYSGINKTPAKGAVWAETLHLEGDGQADLKVHGGPDKAICVYPVEHYSYWRNTLNKAGIQHGSFGENFTTRGLTEESVCIGDIFNLEDVLVQVSEPRGPCSKLARFLGVPDIIERVKRNGYTGWYMRVLEEGPVEADMEMVLEKRMYKEWTISRVNQIIANPKADLDATRRLSECPALGDSTRGPLMQLLDRGERRK